MPLCPRKSAALSSLLLVFYFFAGTASGEVIVGRLLLRTPQIERAIAALETAERSVRDDPGVYYALGRAYARAGRTQDAERARATFRRLTEERERAGR